MDGRNSFSQSGANDADDAALMQDGLSLFGYDEASPLDTEAGFFVGLDDEVGTANNNDFGSFSHLSLPPSPQQLSTQQQPRQELRQQQSEQQPEPPPPRVEDANEQPHRKFLSQSEMLFDTSISNKRHASHGQWKTPPGIQYGENKAKFSMRLGEDGSTKTEMGLASYYEHNDAARISPGSHDHGNSQLHATAPASMRKSSSNPDFTDFGSLGHDIGTQQPPGTNAVLQQQKLPGQQQRPPFNYHPTVPFFSPRVSQPSLLDQQSHLKYLQQLAILPPSSLRGAGNLAKPTSISETGISATQSNSARRGRGGRGSSSRRGAKVSIGKSKAGERLGGGRGGGGSTTGASVTVIAPAMGLSTVATAKVKTASAATVAAKQLPTSLIDQNIGLPKPTSFPDMNKIDMGENRAGMLPVPTSSLSSSVLVEAGASMRMRPSNGNVDRSCPDMLAIYSRMQTEEERRNRRLARNRASARLRRQKKKGMVDKFEDDVATLERTLAKLKAHKWGSSGLLPTAEQVAMMKRQMQRIEAENRDGAEEKDKSPTRDYSHAAIPSAGTSGGTCGKRLASGRVDSPKEVEKTDMGDGGGFVVHGPVDIREALLDVRDIVNADRSALGSGIGKNKKGPKGLVKGSDDDDNEKAQGKASEDKDVSKQSNASAAGGRGATSGEGKDAGEGEGEDSSLDIQMRASDFIAVGAGSVPPPPSSSSQEEIVDEYRRAGVAEKNAKRMRDARAIFWQQQDLICTIRSQQIEAMALPQIFRMYHLIEERLKLAHPTETNTPPPTSSTFAMESTNGSCAGNAEAADEKAAKIRPTNPYAAWVKELVKLLQPTQEQIATLVNYSDIPPPRIDTSAAQSSSIMSQYQTSSAVASKSFPATPSYDSKGTLVESLVNFGNKAVATTDQYPGAANTITSSSSGASSPRQRVGGLADDVLELAVLNKCLEALQHGRWLETPTMDGVMEAWRQLLTPQQQKVFETWLEMNEDTISRLDLSRAQNQGWIVKDRCGSAMMGNRGGGTLAQDSSSAPVFTFSAPLPQETSSSVPQQQMSPQPQVTRSVRKS